MPTIKLPFDLAADEELMFYARPHPLAMLSLMLFWLFIAGLGVFYIVFHKDIVNYFSADLFKLGSLQFISNNAYNIVWAASLLLPLVVMAVFRINFGYVIVLLLLIAARVLIWWKAEEVLGIKPVPHPHLENFLLIAAGIVGVAGVELFRRGHRYYVTTHRIVARFGNLSVSERYVLFSKIDDLMLQKSLIGRIFNFGTVIPITSSGIGMGQDLAIAGASAGGGKGPVGAGLFAAGGKVKNVPRDLSIYVLYRVSRPEEARDMILEEMQCRENPRRQRPRREQEDDTEA